MGIPGVDVDEDADVDADEDEEGKGRELERYEGFMPAAPGLG